MAIGYARVDPISRSRGQSICARMAYVFRTAIADPRTLRQNDYTRKKDDIEASGMVGWNGDASSFAIAAAAAETRGNACEGRSAIFALPHELDAIGRLRVVQQTCRDINSRHRVAVAYAIHRPDPHGSHLNWHVHLIISSRRTEDGLTFGKKARELDNAKTGGPALVAWREQIWAKHCTEELRRVGSDAQVDMRSWKRRLAASGLPPELIEPYEHLGPARAAVERKARTTAAGRRNRRRRFCRQSVEPVLVERETITRAMSAIENEPARIASRVTMRLQAAPRAKGRPIQLQRAMRQAQRILDRIFDEVRETAMRSGERDIER